MQGRFEKRPDFVRFTNRPYKRCPGPRVLGQFLTRSGRKGTRGGMAYVVTTGESPLFAEPPLAKYIIIDWHGGRSLPETSQGRASPAPTFLVSSLGRSLGTI